MHEFSEGAASIERTENIFSLKDPENFLEEIITQIKSHTSSYSQPVEKLLYLMSNPKTESFCIISYEKISLEPYWDGWIGATTFFLDNRIQHYERRVDNLYDMIGDIVCINQVVMTIFMVIMNIYTNKVYDYVTANEFLNKKFYN